MRTSWKIIYFKNWYVVAGDINLQKKALFCNTQYFYTLDSDMKLSNNNTHRTHCCASTAKWLRERATLLLYTYIAYRV
jgi:hypothetical protein